LPFFCQKRFKLNQTIKQHLPSCHYDRKNLLPSPIGIGMRCRHQPRLKCKQGPLANQILHGFIDHFEKISTSGIHQKENSEDRNKTPFHKKPGQSFTTTGVLPRFEHTLRLQ